VYGSSCEPISELQSVTCHTGSHSVACHQTQANALTPAKQASTRFTYPIGMKGWVDLGGCLYPEIVYLRDLRSFEIQFHSNQPFWFDTIRKSWTDSQIWTGRACPLLVVVKQLKPLMALSGTVYRLASSMSDHTAVLFNVFEDWNEESVVRTSLFIRFVLDSNANGRFAVLSDAYDWFDLRFVSNVNSQFAGPSFTCPQTVTLQVVTRPRVEPTTSWY